MRIKSCWSQFDEKRKDIILAGGSGTQFYPIILGTSMHLHAANVRDGATAFGYQVSYPTDLVCLS